MAISDQYGVGMRVDPGRLLADELPAPCRQPDGSSASGNWADLLPDGSVVVLRHGDGTVQALRSVALTEDVPLGEERTSLTLDSPLGRALAGRRAGDCVSYQTPAGTRRAEIVRIHPPEK